LVVNSYAQKSKFLSFELLGSGGLASLNYESQFLNRDLTDLYFRAGFSVMPIDANNGAALIFPLMVHSTIGKSSHKLDIGLGQTFTITTKGQFFLRMPFSTGYRFEPEDKKYYLRASYTPIISYIYNFQSENWGGLTFGYRIK